MVKSKMLRVGTEFESDLKRWQKQMEKRKGRKPSLTELSDNLTRFIKDEDLEPYFLRWRGKGGRFL